VGAIDHAPGPPAVAVRHAARRERWHAKASVRPVEKSARRKVKEAVSSLLLATVSASLLAIGVGTILGFEKSEEIVLLGLVGTAGSWAVLAPSKWLEGTTGDAVMRRFVLGGLGAGVGAFAGVAAHEMFVTLPNTPALFIDLNREVGWHTPAPHLYSPAGQPFTGAHAVYYASLFLVLRWWRLADPYRKKRFRFASLAGVAFWAWLVSEFWEYPDPWAVACGVLIAAVVQLASPWHPEEMAPVEAREVAV
jgi:hypothetical protein